MEFYLLSDIETRRLFMEDNEWNRTSDSWKELIPMKNFNCLSESDETVDEYYLRLQDRFSIPLDVLKQWLYSLYYNIHTVNNYGWFNFEKIEFVESYLNLTDLKSIRVINNFKEYVEKGAKYEAYEELPCTDKDKRHWKEFGTWRTPPIILDVSSLPASEIPSYSDVEGTLQLVEGHSRLGYLYAISNCKLHLNKNHKVYLIRYKNA
jgi:hypothetical protein